VAGRSPYGLNERRPLHLGGTRRPTDRGQISGPKRKKKKERERGTRSACILLSLVLRFLPVQSFAAGEVRWGGSGKRKCAESPDWSSEKGVEKTSPKSHIARYVSFPMVKKILRGGGKVPLD